MNVHAVRMQCHEDYNSAKNVYIIYCHSPGGQTIHEDIIELFCASYLIISLPFRTEASFQNTQMRIPVR